MSGHFQKELRRIKQMVLSLGTLVEERVQMVNETIESQDGARARQIIEKDYEIDQMEIDVEEECLKALALYQPVAVDLRFLIAVIKINNDLERIGDEAVNIAERVEFLSREVNIPFQFDYTEMAEKAQEMLKKSLDALVNMDLDLAYQVLTMDDEVDQNNRDAYDAIKDAMKELPEGTGMGCLINMIFIARHLERIADHATNIAEEVIYMIEGDIVRHGNL
jgi:phosphate transport system protein